MNAALTRCDWCGDNPLYVAYHDHEWGVPVHEDQRLFELIVLEGAQAGLSWITILRKREAYREAFANFDPAVVARYDARKIARLCTNPDIVRNQRKIAAAVQNARAFLRLQKKHGSFDAYQWRFTAGKPIQNRWRRISELPAKTALSLALSKDLQQRGFSFVGPTIVYAHMQAVGMVNDHLVSCFRHRQLGGERAL